MRLTFILVCCMTFYAAASSYSQNTKLSLSTKNSTIVDLIRDIEARSKFVFLYQAGDLNLDKRINADFKNATIHEILDVVLKDEGVSYEVFDRQILITKEASAFNRVMQQPRNLSGVVTDKTGQAIPGASIIIKGTTNGTITNVEGRYILSNVTGDAILQFSFVGMKTQEIPVAGKTGINVVMEEEAIGLEEVVAIGYGTQKSSRLSNAVSSVKGKDLSARAVGKADEALIGKIAGVRTQQVTGSPGKSIDIKIRGVSS
ncbi:MAG: carboxypeptidase-like regulatory domain-containing protein, partial [Mangrovibacterium sp.]|nr:carboxypeptidase-like regulatory domain-containing protein [Mangrovibacterium sp.]